MILKPNAKNSLVTLEDLERRPDPEPMGSRHVPVRYDEVVRTVHKLVPEITGREITGQEMVLARQDGVLLAIWELGLPNTNAPIEEQHTLNLACTFSEKEMRVAQANLGAVISICTNLMIMGGDVLLKHRHTAGLDFERRLKRGLERLLETSHHVADRIEYMNRVAMPEPVANDFIIDMVRKDVIPPSKSKEVIMNYYEPIWPDCQPRTALGLYNAVTRSFRDMVPMAKIERSAKLDRFMKHNA